MKRVLLLFHSRSGTTARAARDAARTLREMGAEAVVERVEPVFDPPYPLWLILSFFPGVRWPIIAPENDPGDFDGCVLLMPKWTFCCPPVETLLLKFAGRFGPTVLVVTCGGWDQERFAALYRLKLEKAGASMAGVATIRKKELPSRATAEALSDLMRKLLSSVKK